MLSLKLVDISQNCLDPLFWTPESYIYQKFNKKTIDSQVHPSLDYSFFVAMNFTLTILCLLHYIAYCVIQGYHDQHLLAIYYFKNNFIYIILYDFHYFMSQLTLLPFCRISHLESKGLTSLTVVMKFQNLVANKVFQTVNVMLFLTRYPSRNDY